MNQKKALKPFGTMDGIICMSFAYSYMIGFTTLNFLLLMITEILWIGWASNRAKGTDDE